jgi:hypothetical protein|tara:strand:+ start:281 stop:673 length:393 start_codon:yes stop_codon:yes gene_type:complete
MKFILLILTLLFVGCDNPLEPEITFLNIYLDSEKDSNGYYHIDYNGTTYKHVYYQTTPNQRVRWGSEDTFSIDWMFNTYEEPIINYSTYADDWGSGQQLFYLDSEAVGDTMMIVGYINEVAWDYLYFILE